MGTETVSTTRYGMSGVIYSNFKNASTIATFAVYTYVYPEYYYKNPDIAIMEQSRCNISLFSEEGPRKREEGWFLLQVCRWCKKYE